MASGFLVAAICGWLRPRWWLAAMIGTLIGEAAFLYWVPTYAWGAGMIVGILPFVAVPALIGAALAAFVRKKVYR